MIRNTIPTNRIINPGVLRENMSITAAEDTNTAELTPDQPCAICGAEHDEDSGTVVGRIDEDSDIPMVLPDPDDVDVEDDPYELSFCNDCIESHLTEIQQSVNILKPSQVQVAAYMLLGLPLKETWQMVNARKEDGSIKRESVRDYRKRARRSLLEAMEIATGASPILKETKKN